MLLDRRKKKRFILLFALIHNFSYEMAATYPQFYKGSNEKNGVRDSSQNEYLLQLPSGHGHGA